MIPVLKISCILLSFLLLAVVLFAGTAGQPGNQKRYIKEITDTVPGSFTPVYLGNKNYQVAILETDFPKVYVNFSTAFPAATKQLWIKEGKTLFAYFLNNGNKVSAVFSDNGHMNYAVVSITLSSVPVYIQSRIQSGYHSWKFLSGKQILTGGPAVYQLVLENHKDYIVLSIDEEDIVGSDTIRKAVDNDKSGADGLNSGEHY